MSSRLSENPRHLPVVAIIGRPNVGKSTFFNRITGARRALTHNRPGVTRDRHYKEVEIDARRFVLIDTGGFEPDAAESDVFRQVREQALLAIDEADVVLMFLDGRQGVIPSDFEIVDLLRTYQKPTLFVVNKIDGPNQATQVYDFYRLGVDTLYPISSEHARGLDPLLDAMLDQLPAPAPDSKGGLDLDEQLEAEARAMAEEHAQEIGLPDTDLKAGPGAGITAEELEAQAEDSTQPSVIRIALVGRPNVGKSSLANKLLGEERQVIHPEAGTTRDSIQLPFEVDGVSYVLIDTAGVRRKAKITDKLEQFTVIKAFRAIEGCDVALLLIDATEGVTSQEKRLAGMIEEKGRGVAILINKWDLMESKGISRREFAENILRELEHIRYAPVHFLSAVTGAGVKGIIPVVKRIHVEHGRSITTHDVNLFLKEAVEAHAPPIHKNHPTKLFYGVQVKTRPPTFMFFTNNSEGVRADYRRYLENQLRERYGFVGSPVHLVIRARKR